MNMFSDHVVLFPCLLPVYVATLHFVLYIGMRLPLLISQSHFTCICGHTTLLTLHWNEATPPNITVSFCGCGPISLGLCFILPGKENTNSPAD